MDWSAIASASGDIISAIGSSLNNWQVSKANIAMEEETRKWNEEMWDKQNQYNDPSAVMARLKAAGLNPNLVYGKGDPGGSAGTPPQGKAPEIKGDFVAPNIQAFLSASLLPFQKDLLKENINNVKADVVNKVVEAQVKGQDLRSKTVKADIDEATSEIVKGTKEAELNIKEQTLRNLEAANKKINADIELKQLEIDYIQGKIDWQTVENHMQSKGWDKAPWWLKSLLLNARKNNLELNNNDRKSPISPDEYLYGGRRY